MSLSVPAKIASFDSTFTAKYRDTVKLPCLMVGQPAPKVLWTVHGNPITGNEGRWRLLDEALQVTEVTREDAGTYTCSVENSFGKDTITHNLVILGQYYFECFKTDT